MIIRQILSRVNDSMHIGLHQIRNDIDIFISCWCWGFLNVNEPNNVLVVEELYKANKNDK